MTKKLTDEQKVARRTCPHCKQVGTRVLYDGELCDDCLKLPAVYPRITLTCVCGWVLKDQKSFEDWTPTPDWCPSCGAIIDDPFEL